MFTAGLVAAGVVAGAGPLAVLSDSTATETTPTDPGTTSSDTSTTTDTTSTDTSTTDTTSTDTTATTESTSTAAETTTPAPSGPPTIASDKDDYAPGELVRLSGTNWQAGEHVHLNVNDNVGQTWTRNVDVVADANGNLTDSFNLPDSFIASYTVTATGALSGFATTAFTDARIVATATLDGGSSVSVGPGASISAVVTVNTDGSGANARWRSTSWAIATTDPTTVSAGTCVDHANHDSAGGPYTESFSLTAPPTGGTFNAYFKAHADDACGGAGGGASALFKLTSAVTVVVDNTAPVGSVSINSSASATNSTSVTLNLAATDVVGVTAYRVANGSDCSGASYVAVTSTPSYSAGIPHSLTAGDGTKTVCAQYKDAAGNQSLTSTDTIVLDTVKPAITAAATSPPGGAAYTAGAWANQNVQVSFTCADNVGGSGIATNTVAGQTVSTEGVTASVSNTGTCTDNAGNTANTTSFGPIWIDKTKPTIAASATSPPGGAGYTAGTWTKQNVKVAFDCQDGGSGIATDTVPDVTLTTDGADQSVTSSGACTDNAGNSAVAATFSNIDIDKTAPSASTALNRMPDHNGWYNAPVGWTTTGSDATSGTDTCSTGTYSTPDGTGLSVSGTCTDKAGNTSAPAASAAFKYDNTAPSAATALDRMPDHNGWYNAPVGWTTTGSDATSGIDTCSTGTYSTPDGTGLSVSGTCTDKAGNTSAPAASAAFKYDNTDPVVTASVSPNPVLLNGSASVTSGATDNLSGVAGSPSCGALDTSTVGSKAVTCAVSDNAGNTGSKTASYSVIFDFTGFFAPVNSPGHVSGVFNTMNAGQAVPLKFSLAGNQGLNIFAAGYPKWVAISCGTAEALDPILDGETVTAGSSSLSYSSGAGQYSYVWKTEKSWAGTCKRLQLKLVDNQTYTADFKFK
jgi:hypothetical protein